MVPTCRECDEPALQFRHGRTKKLVTLPLCQAHWSSQQKVVASRRERPPRRLTKAGYMLVLVGSRYEPEHRIVMEGVLGRPLRKGESVHHRNGVRDDNRPENLELWVGAIRKGQRACDVTCPHCGVPYDVERR